MESPTTTATPEDQPPTPEDQPPTPEDQPPTKAEFIYHRLQDFYNSKYYWETLKSIIIFLLGLKIANECYHIVIPIRDYEPFKGFCGGRYGK